MNIKQRFPLSALLAAIFLFFNPAHAQTNASDAKAKTPDTKIADVDNVVANPGKFKNKINVGGRVAKVDADKKLLMLGCEDACVAMPVKFSGTMPKAGSDVVVSGQIIKDAEGHYLFNADSVTPKK